MKRMIAMLLALLLATPALASPTLASASVLMLELPQDAQMVENVEFDDGDFIQTYQLSGGASVQLLRYATMDLTLGDLIASEWIGCTDVRELSLGEVDGCAAEGLRFAYQEDGQEALEVALIVVSAPDGKLVWQAVYPAALGEGQIDADVQAMIDSLGVMGEETAAEADVG